MQNPAVIIPGDRTATLGIARSLGRKGIQVFCVDPDPKSIGMVSKFTEAVRISSLDESDNAKLNILLNLGIQLDHKAVLYPVSDVDTIFCSRFRDTLSQYYYIVMPDHQKIINLVSKDGLQHAANQSGIFAPKNISINEEDSIDRIAKRLEYPVILKPVFSASWSDPAIIALLDDHPLSNPPKVALCNNADELISKYNEIADVDPNLIIQEVIPGEDSRLYYGCFYTDRDSNLLAFFAGQKLRILPVGFGSATYVNSVKCPEILELSRQFLKDVGYRGLGGIEYKKDPRDDKFKLIEFNARFGLWDSLSVRCGIDIPYIAYKDAIGDAVSPQTDYIENIKWIDFERDIRASIIYNGRNQLGFFEWMKSYFGKKMWSVFSYDDILPSLIPINGLFSRALRLVRRLN